MHSKLKFGFGLLALCLQISCGKPHLDTTKKEPLTWRTVAGEWAGQCDLKVEIVSVTKHITFHLTGTSDGKVIGTYAVEDGTEWSGGVSGEIASDEFNFTLDQTSKCKGQYSGTAYLQDGSLHAVFSGHDCYGSNTSAVGDFQLQLPKS